MSATSPARNHRMTMEELLQEEEKSQAQLQLQHAYFKSISLKDVVETRDMQEEGGKTRKQTEKKCRESPVKQASCTAYSSFSNFIRKKTKISFRQWRTNKMKNAVNVGEDQVRKKEEGSISIGRSSDRKSVMGEGVEERDGEKEEGFGGDGGFELCRRRILMGEKCKPLNISGTLRYDESGILLPEEIWTKDS